MNRMRAAAGWFGSFLEKAQTFPDLHGLSNVGDLSDYDRLKEKLSCRDLGCFLQRFAFIYRDAGLIPDSIFRMEANGMCLEYSRDKGTSPDGKGKATLKKCSTSERQFWGLRNRRTNGARGCCNGIGAWDTDQCLSSVSYGQVELTVCDVSGGNWAQLWSFDAKGHIVLPGSSSNSMCLQVEGGDRLTKVKCTQPDVTVWRKRDERVPLEKTLYDDFMREDMPMTGSKA